MKKSYCKYCNSASAPKIHYQYHKNEYGINPIKDKLFFEALILEINQMRQDLYSVPQITEGHMLNVIMSELLISFKK